MWHFIRVVSCKAILDYSSKKYREFHFQIKSSMTQLLFESFLLCTCKTRHFTKHDYHEIYACLYKLGANAEEKMWNRNFEYTYYTHYFDRLDLLRSLIYVLNVVNSFTFQNVLRKSICLKIYHHLLHAEFHWNVLLLIAV